MDEWTIDNYDGYDNYEEPGMVLTTRHWTEK